MIVKGILEIEGAVDEQKNEHEEGCVSFSLFVMI